MSEFWMNFIDPSAHRQGTSADWNIAKAPAGISAASWARLEIKRSVGMVRYFMGKNKVKLVDCGIVRDSDQTAD
jgi:hypothetical protein